MSGVLLVALSLALIMAWAAAGSLTALAKLFPKARLLDSSSSTRWRAATVLAPGMLGLVVLLVVLLPSPLSHCHCLDHGDGHPHLCIRHPWLALPLVGAAAPIVAIWLGFAALRVFGVGRELLRGELWARQLRREPAQQVDGVEVRFVEAFELGAFTIGLWQPLVVIDRSLWLRLDPVERLAVLHHEHAHATRGDALTQACLRAISALLPWSAQGPWLRDWRTATEVVCDRHAARKLEDATTVARALVSVERLRAHSRVRPELAPALGVSAGGDLSLRVRALLGEQPVACPPLTSDLRPIGVALLGISVLLVAWPGGFFHHAAESLLGLLTLTHH